MIEQAEPVEMSCRGTDEELLLAYARRRAAGEAGSREALSELVKRRWPDAYRLALRALGDPAAAEDAAQEVFVSLARRAGRFARGRPFAPYFHTLVMNAVRNSARARRRRRVREEACAARVTLVSEGEGERRLVAGEIEEHVRRLPLDLRFPVILHFYEGRAHAEVAEVIGCPVGTASSRIRRGLETLRASLAGAGFAAALPDLESLLLETRSAPIPATPAPPAPGPLEFAAGKAALAALVTKLGLAVVALAVAALCLHWLGLMPSSAGTPAGAPLSAASAPASDGTIELTIVDQGTGRPVEGAVLFLNSGIMAPVQVSGTSDATGVLRASLPCGSYSGEVRTPDGRQWIVPFSVTSGRTTQNELHVR